MFSYKVHKYLRDSLSSIYDSRSSAAYHKLINKQMIFMRTRQHLHFCHNNKSLNVFSCKGNIIRNGSFFNTYVCRKSMFFNIFFHIGRPICLHCISPFFKFYRNCILQFLLIYRKVGIFRYGIAEGINEDSIDLVFFDMAYHMSVLIDHDQLMGF